MRKILTSFLTIGAVALVAFGATQAFFSDTETSTGNVLQAGAIDLLIDNHAWFNGVEVPELTWGPTNITNQLFFNFLDLKPGDWEEDTVSIHVNNNEAWVCASANITLNSDEDITEPEDETGGGPGQDATPGVGDLAEELNFIFWADDGDNVLETDETIFLAGPASGVLNGGSMRIADSTGSIFNNLGPLNGLIGAQDYFLGKAFCYGTFGESPVAPGNNSPANNPGFTCSGESVTNLSQTDRIEGDISFYAEQARNNPNFVCIPE